MSKIILSPIYRPKKKNVLYRLQFPLIQIWFEIQKVEISYNIDR